MLGRIIYEGIAKKLALVAHWLVGFHGLSLLIIEDKVVFELEEVMSRR